MFGDAVCDDLLSGPLSRVVNGEERVLVGCDRPGLSTSGPVGLDTGWNSKLDGCMTFPMGVCCSTERWNMG